MLSELTVDQVQKDAILASLYKLSVNKTVKAAPEDVRKTPSHHFILKVDILNGNKD